jgi:hypothetical protein
VTEGLHAVNTLRNVSYTEKANVYVKLHTGDPGGAGTSNASSVTTRPEVTFGAAASGSMTSSNTPSWATWAGDDGEEVTHISVWDAATEGDFLLSAELSASKTVNSGDTLNLTALTIALTPIAA